MYFRGESDVHRLKVRMFLDFRNVGQAGIGVFPQKLEHCGQDWLDGGTKNILGSLGQTPLPSLMSFEP